MSGNELPKVIDKTQADIDAAIDAIKSCDLPSGTKDFAISCIKLAVWLPKALLEQKIRLSNLRKLIFVRGKNKRSKLKGGDQSSAEKPEPEPPANDIEISPSEPPAEEPSAPTNCTKLSGHGRLPHTAYGNTVEHTLAISDLNPFYRQAYFQSLLEMPLPASTQWQLIEEVFGVAIYVFDDHDIALFYNGTQHAGENLTKLLDKRHPDNEPVIQMCDALSRNIPTSFKTILCNCLSHGLRKFDDLTP